jgi:hypothetical protein
LRWHGLIRHVKPRPSPAYGGIQGRDEGICLGSSWKKAYCSAGPKESVVLIVGPHGEEELEHVYSGADSKVSFAEGYVTRYRHLAVWRYMV